MSLDYFNPEGPVVSITGTTSSPTALQVSSATGVPCPAVLMQNINATIDATVGWGATTIEAAFNCSVSTSPNQYYLPAAQQVVIAGKPDGFYAAQTGTGTATIKIQAGVK